MKLKMNALLIAVLIFGAIFDANCRPLEEMDNDIEPSVGESKIERQDWVKITKAPLRNYVQAIGERVEIECEVMGSPAPHVEWFEGDYYSGTWDSNTVIESSPNAIVRIKKVLVIDYPLDKARTFTCEGRVGGKRAFVETTVSPSAEIKNGGNYNELVSSLSHKYHGTKPKIINSHSLHIDIVGSDIILPCDIVGSPRPSYYWMNSDGFINDQNPRYKVLPNGGLLIANIKWEDMGAYKCVAKNTHGKDSADTFIYPALKENK